MRGLCKSSVGTGFSQRPLPLLGTCARARSIAASCLGGELAVSCHSVSSRTEPASSRSESVSWRGWEMDKEKSKYGFEPWGRRRVLGVVVAWSGEEGGAVWCDWGCREEDGEVRRWRAGWSGSWSGWR